jgi:apolipoprotein N-acyltransferase
MVQSRAANGLGRMRLPSLHALGWAAASVLAGLVHAWGVCAPWNGQPVWWLQIIALAALVALVECAPSAKQAALRGWLFALSWIAGSTWWLFISMHTYGGLAAPLAVLAVLALSGFLALYYAAACAFYKRVSQSLKLNRGFLAIIFAASWLLAELARDTWMTGFPWAASGYAHVDGPLAAYASYVGVYGLGFVASSLAAFLGFACLRQPIKRWVWIGSAAVLAVGVGLHYLPSDAVSNQAEKTSIALLQGNIPQGEKFDNSKGIPFALDWYAQQLMQSTATMTVTPETAVPVLPQQLPPGYWDAVQKPFATGARAALVGVPLGSFELGYTNSMLGLAPNKLPSALNVMQPQPYRYDKHHLVPFGEFIPPLFKWFIRMMNIPLGDFNRGAVGQDSFAWAGQRWAPNICYEDLFGDELAARFIDPTLAPSVLVNTSNIGWFGNSIAIDQHLQISRMRALELRRPMVRATNTGPTVIINHLGEVTHSLPRHTRGVLLGQVQGRTGMTPYAWWAARLGLWPLWLLGLAVLTAALLHQRQQAKARQDAALPDQ